MDIDSQPLAIDGTVIREGTGLYDTTFDRVLWITEIDTHGITVTVADPYREDAPLWWTPGGDPTLIANGSRLGTTQFRELIETGRFEVGPNRNRLPHRRGATGQGAHWRRAAARRDTER